MNSLPISLLTAFSTLFLASCGVTTPKVAGADSRVKLEQWLKAERVGIEETDKLIGLQIPLVDFGKLPATFGKQRWSAGTRGQYSTSYDKTAKIAGGECYHVSLFGTPAAAPVLVDAPSVLEPGRPGEMDESPRKWSSVHVPGLNRSIRYYFSTMAFGDTDDTWETEPFTITGPDGKTGSYQARIECETSGVAEAMFAKLRVR
ncbi:MAG: hypothetical protein V4584_08835 [Verrucomicrobiota bacterium]